MGGLRDALVNMVIIPGKSAGGSTFGLELAGRSGSLPMGDRVRLDLLALFAAKNVVG